MSADGPVVHQPRHGGLFGQFELPRGPIGRLCGWIMAAFNADMERAVVAALAPHPDDAVLEVGFGPGIGIHLLASAVPQGRVAGIDPSAAMLAQATRRCRDAIAAGRVELRLGSVSALPWGDASFDAVCSSNSVHFWRPLGAALDEVRRVLRPGGRLVLATHAWAATDPIEDGVAAGRPLAEGLPAAVAAGGFDQVRTWQARAHSGNAVYLVARAA